MAIARHRTSRRTRWLARQSRRYVAATTVYTSIWTLEPTTTTRAPFLSLSASPDLIGRFWSALPFFNSMAKICPIFLWLGLVLKRKPCLEGEPDRVWFYVSPVAGMSSVLHGARGVVFLPISIFCKIRWFAVFLYVELSACFCVTVSVASLTSWTLRRVYSFNF